MMNVVLVTRLYESLFEKIGKESAENLTSFIEGKIKEEVNNTTPILASKEDIGRLDVKISEVKGEMIKWMFIFWASQILAMFGFVVLFIKR